MKVFVKGSGEVTLSTTNFVAEGGQAAVYQKNGTAYKVYTDPRDTIPEAKFLELSKITDASVIRPERLLLEPSTHAPIGYTMRFLEGTLALCQIFPRVFRERRGLTEARVQELVHALRQHIVCVHEASVAIVDLNELNVLVASALDAVFLIDVDSYQTRSFPAEVIMPSVRDYSVTPKEFGVLSDWFSFAVLAFQMYVGVHPYKGTHPRTAHVHPDQRLEVRMRERLSAFGKEVTLPKAAYPLDVIPALERAWMRAVLEEGKRLPPPDPSAPVPAVTAQPVQKATPHDFGGALEVVLVRTLVARIVAYASSGTHEVVLTSDGALYADQTFGVSIESELAKGTAVVGFTPKLAIPVALVLTKDKRLWLAEPATRAVADFGVRADELQVSKHGFLVRMRDRVHEVEFMEAGHGVHTASASHAVAQVLESAARLYEGCTIQMVLGGLAFVSVFPRSHAGYQVRMPELDRCRIVDAKFEGGVLMVVAVRAGAYERLVFRFDDAFRSYDVRTAASSAGYGTNFLVTDRGVCVCLNEDDELEVFLALKGTSAPRIVKDKALGGDMRLLHVRGGVGFVRGSEIFTMRLK